MLLELLLFLCMADNRPLVGRGDTRCLTGQYNIACGCSEYIRFTLMPGVRQYEVGRLQPGDIEPPVIVGLIERQTCCGNLLDGTCLSYRPCWTPSLRGKWWPWLDNPPIASDTLYEYYFRSCRMIGCSDWTEPILYHSPTIQWGG